MKKIGKFLVTVAGVACLSIAMSKIVFAADGIGTENPFAECSGGGPCYNVLTWVRIKNSNINKVSDLGGNKLDNGGSNENVSDCKGQDLYILALMYHSGHGMPGDSTITWYWDGAHSMKYGGINASEPGQDGAWNLGDRSSGNFYPGLRGVESIHVQHDKRTGIANATTAGTGRDLARTIVSRAFEGKASYVSLGEARDAYNKDGAKYNYAFAYDSKLGWFCSPGDETTETKPLSEEAKFDGQTTVSYKYGDKTYHNGDTVSVMSNNTAENVTVTPTFSHCLKKTEGAKEASTNWNVPANRSGGKAGWGNGKDVSSNCQGVKTDDTISKEIKVGDEGITVCRELGFYARATRTGTRTIKKVGGKVVSDTKSWGNWSVDTSSWTTRKACITFRYPYYYKTGSYTYEGKVTGKTDNQVLNGCNGVVSTSGNRSEDCFIKSEDPEMSGTTTVSFQDELSRTGGESGEWYEDSDYNSRSGEFGDISVLDSNWQVEGITGPKEGHSSGGVVKNYGSNKKNETIKLGYSSKNKYNKLTWDKTVKYVRRSDGKYLVIGREGRGEAQVTFNLYHPYNYKTSASAEILGDLYVGSTGQAKVIASYSGRKNNLVTGNDTEYKTVLPTHAGRYYAVFTVNSTEASAVQGLTKDSGTNFWSRVNENPEDLCGVVRRSTNGVVVDCEGGKIEETPINFKVPDDYGVKVCVVAGVNYADSHGAPDMEAITEERMNMGEAAVPEQPNEKVGINSPDWRVSWAACKPVKAKPRIQNWNAGFYTEGKVNMSVENKVPGQLFSLGDSDTLAFGSWSETSFIQGGKSTGFASSSKLGGMGMSGYNYCKSSPVSIANVGKGATCSEATNNLVASGVKSATKETAEKTLMRYMPSAKDLGGGNVEKQGELAKVGGKVPGRYHYYAGNNEIKGRTVKLEKNSTQVIIVNGTAKITGNICVGDGTCGSGGDLKVEERNKDYVSDIAKLANVVIIADKIEVAPEVTQIDAILMALGNGGVKKREMGEKGVVDTCSGLDGTNEKVQACMHTLYVNGPVFAGSLKLNRTIYKTKEGAYITPTQDLQEMGSATAAEIFNLNPYVYMWAFEQASRYTQAETVYMQELAPRL